MTAGWVLAALTVAVLLAVAIDAALEARDRRREPEPCSHYSRCPECRADWGKP